MAFAFSGTSGTNSATITQTSNYTVLTVTTGVTTSGANWSFVCTVGPTVQAGATVADCIGRAVINTTKAGTITARNQIASSWISSITSITVSVANVTVTGPRYFLSDGTEDVFVAAVGDSITICQNERDLVAAATTDTNSLIDSSASYPSVAGARTDIPWGVGKYNFIRLGTPGQACRFVINGAFCISDNTHIGWAAGGSIGVPGATLQLNNGGVFIMGRHYTLAIGTNFATDLLYPGVSLTSDTIADRHVANMNCFVNSNAYAYFGGTIGGSVWGCSTFEQNSSTRLHFRKAVIWSVGNTATTNTNPTIFCGSVSASPSIVTIDELTLSGSHVIQREGSTLIIYSLINRGGGLIQALNPNATVVNGYTNAGSQNGFDFGGYTCAATSAGGLGANYILSYNSTLGTNCYVGSADATFAAGNQQTINIEFHRNLTVRAVNSVGTLLTTPVAYLKCATRTTGTTASAPRGAVSAAPDGNQAGAGFTVTARSLVTVLFDGAQVQYDRTYTATSGGAAVDVLLGECYTNDTTGQVTSRVGRLGYEGNSGNATNRISRRGKDDTVASRNNRDNYDIFWWDYNSLFGKASDFSLNANGTQTQILLTDANITQTNPVVVSGYTSLETTTKIYDYFKFYKTYAPSLDTRTQLTRLEMGGIDGTNPGATLANGGGGYLCYAVGSTLFFNLIFNAVTINASTNASPMGVLSAQGPINGSWNALSSTYNYGDARRSTSTATVQGGLTFFAGLSTIAAAGNFNTLNFGAVNITLNAVATAAGNWATIVANQITLGPATTLFQNLTATTSIINLLGVGTIASGSTLGFGTGTSITLTGDVSFVSTLFSGTCTLNVGATSRNLTLTNCGTITTFPFLRGGTATIQVVAVGTTVLPVTLPAGFIYNIQTVVRLTFSDAPATAPTLRTSEVYKNGTTVPVPLGTPTYASGTYTWNIVSAPADVFNGGIVYADGYLPTRLTSAVNTLVSGTALPETSVDFGIVLATADTNFIATTAWFTTNIALATNAYALMTTTQAIDYQTISATRSAVEVGKLVWRRTYETSNANTILFRRALAIGTLLTNFVSFNTNGVSINGVTGTATTGVGAQLNKDASRTNTITWAIWAVDAVGNFYALNNANGRASSTITTIILWEGFAPGAVSSLNTSQINQISSGVSTTLVGTAVAPGALGKIATGINTASGFDDANINLFS